MRSTNIMRRWPLSTVYNFFNETKDLPTENGCCCCYIHPPYLVAPNVGIRSIARSTSVISNALACIWSVCHEQGIHLCQERKSGVKRVVWSKFTVFGRARHGAVVCVQCIVSPCIIFGNRRHGNQIYFPSSGYHLESSRPFDPTMPEFSEAQLMISPPSPTTVEIITHDDLI